LKKSDLSYSHLEYSKLLLKWAILGSLSPFRTIQHHYCRTKLQEKKQKKINVAGINLQIDEYKED
jgi:hypothetical protein